MVNQQRYLTDGADNRWCTDVRRNSTSHRGCGNSNNNTHEHTESVSDGKHSAWPCLCPNRPPPDGQTHLTDSNLFPNEGRELSVLLLHHLGQNISQPILCSHGFSTSSSSSQGIFFLPDVASALLIRDLILNLDSSNAAV